MKTQKGRSKTKIYYVIEVPLAWKKERSNVAEYTVVDDQRLAALAICKTRSKKIAQKIADTRNAFSILKTF